MGGIGVGVYAGMERGKPDRNADLVQQDAQPNKTVQTGDGEEKTVTYVGTDEENNMLDVYEDEGGNRYSYNQEGDLSSYYNRSDVEADGTAEITDETAAAYGWSKIRELYGDRVEDFVFVSCKQEGSNPVGYAVKYGKVYGKDGFILGSYASVRFFADGVVKVSSLNREELLDYDPTLLADMTPEKIAEAIRKEHNTNDVEVDVVQLVTEGGVPVLRVGCRIDGKMSQYLYEL